MDVIGLLWKVLVFSSWMWFLPSQMGEVILQTKYGKILGISQAFPGSHSSVKRINKFLGIPFAKKPLGSLRFKPPQAIEKWKGGFFNATSFGNICIHPPSYIRGYSYLVDSIKKIWPEFTEENVSEDCLYLNIFAPAAERKKRRYPVLFYIHGGSYLLGTPNRIKTPGEITPLYGVVLVTIHYRLGALGFFTTGDDAAPGNYGMLDQVQALRWVKENIASFGGDPNKITICGNSAGGSSVGLHLLSPLTKGLFQSAIIESGSELSPFAILPRKEALDKSKRLARKMLCDRKKHKDVVKCLQTKDAEDLAFHYPEWPGPVVDGHYLPDTPENLRKAGKFHRVPLILGFTQHDGVHMLQQLELPKTLDKQLFRKGIERGIQMFMGIRDRGMAMRLADALELVYYPWGKTADHVTLEAAMVDMCTDYYIAGPTIACANYHSQYSPTYVFEFRHLANYSKVWVQHSSNVDFSFGAPHFNASSSSFDDQDREMSHFILQLYSNFIKDGQPTPLPVENVNWTQYSQPKGAYLKLQLSPQLAHAFEPRRMAFWNYYVPKLEQFSCSAEISSKSSACCVVSEVISHPGVLGLLIIYHLMGFLRE